MMELKISCPIKICHEKIMSIYNENIKLLGKNGKFLWYFLSVTNNKTLSKSQALFTLITEPARISSSTTTVIILAI